jgi:hypothetical protein
VYNSVCIKRKEKKRKRRKSEKTREEIAFSKMAGFIFVRFFVAFAMSVPVDP